MSQDGLNFCQHFGIFCATKGGPCFVPVSHPFSRASRMPPQHCIMHSPFQHQPFSFDLEELRVHLSMTNFCTATVFLTSHVLLATLPIQHGSSEPNMRLSGVRRMAKLSSSAPTMRKSRACMLPSTILLSSLSTHVIFRPVSNRPAGINQSQSIASIYRTTMHLIYWPVLATTRLSTSTHCVCYVLNKWRPAEA